MEGRGWGQRVTAEGLWFGRGRGGLGPGQRPEAWQPRAGWGEGEIVDRRLKASVGDAITSFELPADGHRAGASRMARHATRQASIGIAQGTATEARRPETVSVSGGSCRPSSSARCNNGLLPGGEIKPPDLRHSRRRRRRRWEVWHDEGRHALCRSPQVLAVPGEAAR